MWVSIFIDRYKRKKWNPPISMRTIPKFLGSVTEFADNGLNNREKLNKIEYWWVIFDPIAKKCLHSYLFSSFPIYPNIDDYIRSSYPVCNDNIWKFYVKFSFLTQIIGLCIYIYMNSLECINKTGTVAWRQKTQKNLFIICNR